MRVDKIKVGHFYKDLRDNTYRYAKKKNNYRGAIFPEEICLEGINGNDTGSNWNTKPESEGKFQVEYEEVAYLEWLANGGKVINKRQKVVKHGKV